MGGCVQILCKHYTTLYQGLKHPWILVSEGDPGNNLCEYRGVTVFLKDALLYFFFFYFKLL